MAGRGGVARAGLSSWLPVLGKRRLPGPVLGVGDARRVAWFTHGGQTLLVTANGLKDAWTRATLRTPPRRWPSANLGQLPTPGGGPVVRGAQMLARGTQCCGDLLPGPALVPGAAHGQVLHLLGQQPQLDRGGQGRPRLPQLPQP